MSNKVKAKNKTVPASTLNKVAEHGRLMEKLAAAAHERAEELEVRVRDMFEALQISRTLFAAVLEQLGGEVTLVHATMEALNGVRFGIERHVVDDGLRYVLTLDQDAESVEAVEAEPIEAEVAE
jgi:hypothetical protein